MEPYLIISDVDGTLSIDHKHVSAPTVKVLQTLIAQGHQFYVATGRMYVLAEDMAKQVSDKAQVIASNGAVYDFGGGRIHHLLGAPALQQVLQVTNQTGLAAFYFSDDTIYYTQDPTPEVEKAMYAFAPDDVTIAVQQIPAAELVTHADTITNGFILGINNPEGLAKTMMLLAAGNFVHLSASNHDNIELIPKQVDKATAVKELQAKTGISAAHTIVFGDGMNDMGMLQEAGVSVAMGNAVDAVKDVARYQTTSNLDDGVAKFLTDYFNL
ncbi:Cof-type HAD-IIB family hydrolase [Lacticaseibacillus brantae]|uniref:Hydrolase of the HAD superfamily protein n=1 Tax=Lacticaseibacillus brantae DSM 23927 TaxID=1423727 RepID=A0A0R2AWF7_9LACO|nr:Cof-type HAD-IIB family hydrolase [Lacticaseibacillus brantae]KRM71328.1 hydrolase of the HAD superfamily protein [Lacticaseibacillus brantae DSM 23927]